MNYILCFWDKSKIQVSEIIGEKLKLAIKIGNIKNFELGKSLYAISGVEKIIPKDEAFYTFPAEWDYLKNLENKIPNAETLTALETAKLK